MFKISADINISKASFDAKEDNKLCNFLGLNVICVFLSNYFLIIEPYTHIPQIVISIGTKLSIALYFIYLVPTLTKKIRPRIYLFIISLFLFFIANYGLFPNLNEYQSKTYIDFLFLCFPSFVIAGHLDGYKPLLEKLFYASKIISLFLFPLLLGYFLGGINIYASGMYFMGFGFSLLIPSCTCIIKFILQNDKKALLIFLICCLAIVLLGSRGPFISIMFISVFAILFLIKKYFFMQAKISILSILKGFIELSFLSIIFITIMNRCINYFSNSRTVSLLLGGQLDAHSSRINIQEKLWQIFFDDFISVRGINSEYLINNAYAHNIILELLFQFGVIVGGEIILFILFKIIKTIICFDGDEHSFIIVMYMGCALCTLLNSSSLWNLPVFWIWIAMTYNLKQPNKRGV